MTDRDNFTEKAKKYSTFKYTFAIIDIVYLLALLFLSLRLGLSNDLARIVSKSVINNYLTAPVYLLIVYIIYYILDFPLNFYSSFILEHKFSLSHQKISDWLGDQFKAGIISYLISLICLEVFYYVLRRQPDFWWLIVSFFWIFFTLVLVKLTPIIIIPLFFKYKKLSDESLRQRIIDLANKMKVKILDVFEIDFSKKTLKANAAFVGVGNTRRVILADTLKDKYTQDEIVAILAHEFSHYRLRHLIKLALISSCATILLFYLIFKTSHYFLNFFGLSSLTDIAALPAIFIYLVLFGFITEPLQNYTSRRFERDADLLALETTGLPDTFISMMEKLSRQNLADRNPHPLIKFLFFDHPPIDERIAMAKSYKLLI